MNIVFLINSLSAGGAEVFVSQLSLSLMRNANITVFTLFGFKGIKGQELRDSLVRGGVKCIHLQGSAPLKLIHLLRFCIDARIDVVHAHGILSEFYSIWLILAGWRGRLVRTIHNTVLIGTLTRFWFLYGAFFDYSVACGESIASTWFFRRLPRGRKCVIPNGIVVPTKKYMPRLRQGRFRFACVGRMDGELVSLQKGQDLIINAAARVDADFLLYGVGSCRAALERHAPANVHFYEPVSSIYAVFDAVDVLIQPSRHEGLSLVVIEAACYGIPIVVSRIPEFSSFASLGVSYIASRSAENIEKACRLVMDDYQSALCRANAATLAAGAQFDIEVCASRYMGVYLDCPNYMLV